jgi:hypothetical protein
VAAVVLDANSLALTGIQNDFEITQIEFLFVPVGFLGWNAFHRPHEIEQALIVQIGSLTAIVPL